MTKTDSESGFSLLELTVALGVMTIVMGAAVALLNGFQKVSRADEIYAEAARNGRFAVGRISEIVRSAGCNPTSLTSVNNATFVTFPNTNGGSSIELKSDLDGDGQFLTSVSSNSDVIVTSEDVTLALNGSSLQLTDNTVVGATPVTVAEDIRSVTFTDPDGSAKSIVVNLTAMPTGVRWGDPNYIEVQFATTIRLRNR
jgi:prepilin-type N-terminal cleavage/methylation domain-containing protein